VDDMEVVEFVGIECDGAPVIEAFPSIGVVAVIVGKEIVKTLGLPLIGIIKSSLFQSSAVISQEQPSFPIRIYGDHRAVVFLCEVVTKFPKESIPNIVDCIYDFAHRHKCPMLYSLEGIPKKEKITLPTGEEVTLALKHGGGGGGGGAGGSGGSDEEEGHSHGGDEEPEEDLPIIVDDTLLAKMTKREEERNKTKTPTPSASKKDESNLHAATPPASPEKKSPAKKGSKGSKLHQSGSVKKGKKKDDKETKEEDEDSDVETIANNLFGDRIHYVTTKHDVAKKLRADGHIPVVDGIVPGVTGGIIAQAPLTEQEVTILLIPSSVIFPDAEAAVKAIKCLTSLEPGLELEKSIKLLEKEGEDLKKLMKGLLSGLDTSSSLKKSGSVPYGMYQ